MQASGVKTLTLRKKKYVSGLSDKELCLMSVNHNYFHKNPRKPGFFEIKPTGPRGSCSEMETL